MADMNDGEIGNFLEKVDQVESLIKGLTSGDSALEKQAAESADELLRKEGQKAKSSTCGFEKTHISKYEDDSSSRQDNIGLQFDQESVSPEDFMKSVEKDAAERRKRKEQNSKIANELKDKGNNAFKRKEYNEAIKYYTDAIGIIKDNAIFYTNRAQAYICLEKYELALQDCAMAQKIDVKCVKAYVHQGRALQNLQRFDEAIKSFESVSKVDKKYKKLVQGYIDEVERRRAISYKEQRSESLKTSGDDRAQMLTDTIKRLRKGGLSLTDLCEKIEELKKVCDKEVYRTLFRTSGGFQIVAENSAINKLFKGSDDYSEEEQCCVFRVLDLLSQVCLESDENIEELLSPSFHAYFQKFIKSKIPSRIRIASACLIHNISQLAVGREFILQGGANTCILDALFTMATENDDASLVAIGAINNLALYDKLPEKTSAKICEKFSSFIVTMMEILSKMSSETQRTLFDSILTMVSKGISTITNLSKDTAIQKSLATNGSLWRASSDFLVSCEADLDDPEKRDVIFSLLGLLMNISLGDRSLGTDETRKINDCCCRLLANQHPEIVERAAGLLNHLSTFSPDLIHHNSRSTNYNSFITVIKGQNDAAKNYIIKCVALCSQQESDLVTCFMEDEENISAKLASTNVVQDLLRIATTDAYANVVKHNAAIAIGRLATSHNRHLERLRELNGLEILHEVLKATKQT